MDQSRRGECKGTPHGYLLYGCAAPGIPGAVTSVTVVTQSPKLNIHTMSVSITIYCGCVYSCVICLSHTIPYTRLVFEDLVH